jgi:GAF domain-containing protein/HAMP domain-containing protein
MSSNARWHQLPAGQSIRTRLLALLLGLTTASVLIIGSLGVNSVWRMGRNAQRISVEALGSQAEEYLRQVTVGGARASDLTLRQVQRDAETVAQYAADVFERPNAFRGEAYWLAADHMFMGPEGQYLNDEADVSSAFVPNTVEMDDQVARVLELGAYLDFVFASTYESDPNTVAIYLGTELDTTQYYPNISLGTLVPPDFQVTQRPWYVDATPGNNPGQGVVWSPVYVDATGKGLMVTAAAPVYAGNDGFVGVVGVDVTLEDISANVEAVRLLGSGYSFLVDDTQHAVALPQQGYQDILGRLPEADEVGTDLSKATTPFAPVLDRMMNGATGFETLEVGGRELFVAYAPLESVGWSMANVVDAETVLQAVGGLEEEMETSTTSLILRRILPVGAGILAIVGVIGILLTNRLTDPVKRLAMAARQIGAGHWDAPLPQPSKDEIGVLTQAFASMTGQLRELLMGLEERVAERTYALEQRSVYLEASAQVARDAAGIRDVGQLLDTTVRLISERFGFYHAGIFLMDDAGECAVLRAASSEGGQQMLARRHMLEVGTGIVGYVAATGEHRVALDVGEDAVFFDNPDLPETRSEMALPLKVRARLIGVLDVQSREAAAFTQEDVAVLQTMADQVALAIDNARLLEQTDERLRELDALLGRYGRQGWRRLVLERPQWGYTYDGLEVAPGDASKGAEADPQLTVPLRVRDEVIGRLNVLLGDHPLTPETTAVAQAVAEQASQALENARLFQEAQRALRETEALYRASQAIGASSSAEDVGKALMNFAATSGVDAARLMFIEYDERGAPSQIEMREGWTADDKPIQSYGMRLALADYPLAHLLDPYEPVIVEDVLADPRTSDMKRTLGTEISDLRSFIIVPIGVGENCIGMILAGRNEPSTFPEGFVRGYETLTGQAAIALESMHLLEETRYRAERERLVSKVTARMRETLDLETVLMTAAQEIRQELDLPEVVVRLAHQPVNRSDGDSGEKVELVSRGLGRQWSSDGGSDA